MTTATAEKPGKPAAVKIEPPKELFIGKVAISRITVKSNIRKHFNPVKMKELVENIKKVGVLENVLLRYAPGGTNGYILIAGERRLRAAKEAGLQDIPARVLDVNEQLAAEIQAFENLHRDDLTPIEEARSFKLLLDTGKLTVEHLAQRIDKSTVYVYRAMRLLELPETIIDAIEEGVLTPAHGHQIARLPKDKRAAIAKKALEQKSEYIGSDDPNENDKQVKTGVMTAKELQIEIDREIGLSLSKVEFPKDAEYAGAVSCAKCPYNTANQGMLFDGATEGRCLNKPCFDKKVDQVSLDLQAEGKKKWPQLSFVGRGEQDLNYKRTITGLPGNAMLSEDEHRHPFIKKLLADKPNKLGYAVVKPCTNGHWDKARVWKKTKLVLAVTDPAIIGGMRTEKISPPKPEKKSKSSSKPKAPSATQQATSKRQDMIDEEINDTLGDAYLEAASKALAKISPAIWLEGAQQVLQNHDVGNDIVAAMLGSDKNTGLLPLLKKASVEQLQKIVVVGAVIGWEVDDESAKALGVDVKIIRAAVEKKAAAKYEEHLKTEKKS